MGFLDSFFALAGSASGGDAPMPADTVTVDTGPLSVGGGAMNLAGGSSAWLIGLGLLAVALVLRRG